MIIEEYFDPDEKIEVTRELVMNAIVMLGGKRPTDRSSNAQLAAELRQLIHHVPATLDGVIAELAKPDLSVTRRARLTWRRIELERAELEPKHKPVGDQVVLSPNGASTLTLGSGRAVNSEVVDGRQVFRLFLSEFRQLAANDQRWANLNPHLAKMLG